jgi:hypothetical protein
VRKAKVGILDPDPARVHGWEARDRTPTRGRSKGRVDGTVDRMERGKGRTKARAAGTVRDKGRTKARGGRKARAGLQCKKEKAAGIWALTEKAARVRGWKKARGAGNQEQGHMGKGVRLTTEKMEKAAGMVRIAAAVARQGTGTVRQGISATTIVTVERQGTTVTRATISETTATISNNTGVEVFSSICLGYQFKTNNKSTPKLHDFAHK